MKKLYFFFLTVFFLSGIQTIFCQSFSVFPENSSSNINPDTHLVLNFADSIFVNNQGKIRVFDATDNKMVDSLDMSIPAGPTVSVNHGTSIPPYTSIPYNYVSDNFTNTNTKPGTPSGLAAANSDTFQLNIIGRFTDAFHFYPVIIHGKTATIYLHNNILEYNKKYYVQIDNSVFKSKKGIFKGINKTDWTFTTKNAAPNPATIKLTVNTDGSGDFNTVQGAIDFVPDYNPKPVTIFIKNGNYEELVYFRNKTNVTFIGEDRDKTIVYYANNEVFNPHPSNISTNEFPGTFPSRRAAFMGDNVSGIKLVNFTIKTTLKGQAEGLLLMGSKNILQNMHIVGSGDALQVNGSMYADNCTIDGDGDTFLSRGPAFFNHCIFNSHATFMWMRNTSKNHGAVLKNCELINTGNQSTEIARSPDNHGNSYTHCEVVLINCKLQGISDTGWGPTTEKSENVHYWEFNSRDYKTNKAVDVSKRSPVSRQLNKTKDAKTILNYSTPSFVLDGWNPEIYK